MTKPAAPNSPQSDTVRGRPDPPLAFSLLPRTVGTAAVSMVVVWVAIHAAFLTLRYAFGRDHVFGLEGVFHLGREACIPTWYSSVTLFVCGLLLTFIAECNRRSCRPDTGYWFGLALLFYFVSLDESIGLHEVFTKPLRESYGLRGMLYQAWVIPYGLAMLVLGGVYVRFLWRLPTTTRWTFLLSLAVFLGGAVGMEMIGGVVFERGGFQRALPIDICVTLEEGFEMLGVALFLRALVDHLHREFPTARLVFADVGQTPR